VWKVLIFNLLLGCAPLLAQEKPLERTLVPGDARRYRVTLKVRSELEGQQTEKIGAKTYVTPVSRVAGATLSWIVTRRTLALDEDKTAQTQETIGAFSEIAFDPPPGADDAEQVKQMREALAAALTKWKSAESRELRFMESTSGQLRGLTTEGAPLLDEPEPRLLTPWMLRALRPTAALPAQPLKFGAGWREPRAVQLPKWSDVHGTESGEWLEAPDARETAARLHIVQQISGKVTGGADSPQEATGEGRFYGESLALISLADGRVLTATRSATREITWTLARVEGLPEPPRFRGKLSVEISIEEIE